MGLPLSPAPCRWAFRNCLGWWILGCDGHSEIVWDVGFWDVFVAAPFYVFPKRCAGLIEVNGGGGNNPCQHSQLGGFRLSVVGVHSPVIIGTCLCHHSPISSQCDCQPQIRSIGKKTTSTPNNTRFGMRVLLCLPCCVGVFVLCSLCLVASFLRCRVLSFGWAGVGQPLPTQIREAEGRL